MNTLRQIMITLMGTIPMGFISVSGNPPLQKEVDVLIVGGGTSGTMAGIQAARMGATTLITEETQWLGGMLSSAGVSAIDGNHRLPSGLWAEFREKLFDYYGGPDSVNTGWVSHVLFEPSVGAKILKELANDEQYLEVRYLTRPQKIDKIHNGWNVIFTSEKDTFRVTATVLIDGTELGDVARMAGVPYETGMDSRNVTGEAIAPAEANDIIQDLTYVAILKDYGKDADKTIPMPENYDPTPFICTCDNDRCTTKGSGQKLWDCNFMMQYGRLPGKKFMINWPINGNDFYANTIDLPEEERKAAYEKAKWHTLCYIYFLQTELGFKNFGIACDEFPSDDGFPLIPYHRESRRIRGIVQFTLNDMAKPFDQPTFLYKTGIAVGDYPVDHHHAAYHDQSQIPDIHFHPVPSYCVPLGTLIPQGHDNLIVTDKSISVTNIVNGSTRLQPVCMLTGQAAGVLAALSSQKKVTPAEISVREVQKKLIEAKAYIQPYSDVPPGQPYWEAVQRIGATGIIKGEGRNEGWANLTRFHPDSLMVSAALLDGINELIPPFSYSFRNEFVSFEEAMEISKILAAHFQKSTPGVKDIKPDLYMTGTGINYTIPPDAYVTRYQMAQILDEIANPFELIEVDYFGHTIK